MLDSGRFLSQFPLVCCKKNKEKYSNSCTSSTKKKEKKSIKLEVLSHLIHTGSSNAKFVIPYVQPKWWTSLTIKVLPRYQGNIKKTTTVCLQDTLHSKVSILQIHFPLA